MVDSARLWQDDEVELVSAIARQLSLAIHQDQLDEQVKEQAEQEYLLDAIIQDIHNNLELEEVLTRAVNNLQVVLKADLCAVALCAEEDTECRLVAMTPLPGIPNITGSFLPLVGNLHLQAILAQEDPVSVTGNLFSTLPWSIEPHLSSAAIGVTIRSGKDRYGLLTVQQCRSARTWTPAESRLLKKVAEQLAVAIQHRQMLLKLKHQAAQFESQIQHRTAQLRQALDYEIVLNRIADKMRNSLDEAQILQTAVAELALALAVPSCHAALYNAAKTTATIRYEHREPNFPSRLQQQVQLADYPEFLSTFLTQVPGHLHESARQEHWLLCPMGDDQEFIGHLGLLQLDEAQPWPQLGIRLAQQVANHCFIALRQARLYQASLSHVVELKRLSELKDDFLSTVSHELRTPVTNMRLAIQLLQESLPTQSAPLNKHQHYLEVLGHECQREIKLINDLLAFQKIDGDRAPLVMTEIQLQTWLPCLIAAFEERFREHKQLFKLEIPHGLPTISTEAGSLERILTELLNNAIKYTPARGRILLKVSPKAKHWEFELSNSGAKIPEPELERIFEKFYRIPSNERWQQPGTGLGLALVKNLVGRLEGEVRVQSPTGAVIFTVHLPYALGT
jgi:signal transduction histidine kinase